VFSLTSSVTQRDSVGPTYPTPTCRRSGARPSSWLDVIDDGGVKCAVHPPGDRLGRRSRVRA